MKRLLQQKLKFGRRKWRVGGWDPLFSPWKVSFSALLLCRPTQQHRYPPFEVWKITYRRRRSRLRKAWHKGMNYNTILWCSEQPIDGSQLCAKVTKGVFFIPNSSTLPLLFAATIKFRFYCSFWEDYNSSASVLNKYSVISGIMWKNRTAILFYLSWLHEVCYLFFCIC